MATKNYLRLRKFKKCVVFINVSCHCQPDCQLIVILNCRIDIHYNLICEEFGIFFKLKEKLLINHNGGGENSIFNKCSGAICAIG